MLIQTNWSCVRVLQRVRIPDFLTQKQSMNSEGLYTTQRTDNNNVTYTNNVPIEWWMV